MSIQTPDPVLIIGGSGIVGAQAARMLRRFHPALPLAIAGRDLAKADAVARQLDNAEAVQVDIDRRGLGLPSGARYSAVAVFLKDHTLNALRYAQQAGIPHISISSGSFEIGPEMALYIHNARSAPVLMASNWLAGAATLPALHFAKAFSSIESIEIAVVLDEQDMGGPAAAADFERLTSAAPYPLFLQDGKWTWVMDGTAARKVTDVDGTEVAAQGYAPLDVLSLASATDAQSIRFDLVYGESASRRLGKPFSTAIIIEIAGEGVDGKPARTRHELVHPQGQAPLTALGVTLAVERLLGLAGSAPVAPGLYLPEVLIDPAYMMQRLEAIGTEVRQVDQVQYA